jgi:hypothetical protein
MRWNFAEVFFRRGDRMPQGVNDDTSWRRHASRETPVVAAIPP